MILRPWLGTNKPPLGVRPIPGHALSDRLVLSWLLNEGSGDRVQDATVNARTGTLTAMDPATDWLPTPYGSGLDFDGTNDYVTGSNPPEITATTPWTVSVIAKSIGTPALKGFWMLGPELGACYWYAVTPWNGLVLTRGAVGNLAYTIGLSADPDITKWHHWHFTWDGVSDRAKAYCDGIDLTAAGTSYVVPETIAVFAIGRAQMSYYPTYSGPMQAAGAWVWAKCLTQAEIGNHCAAPWSMFGVPDLAAMWAAIPAAGATIPIMEQYYRRLRVA